MKRDAALEAPLVVDLDGTLLRTDLLFESAVRLLRHNPLYVFLMPLWLLAGKPTLKREIARRVQIDVSRLPFNEEFLEYLRAEAASGRRLVLATATHHLLARPVHDHLGLFGELLCTDDARNLSGARKRDTLVERFGREGFDYAGNSNADVAVWRHARKSIVVAPAIGVRPRVQRLGNVEREFTVSTPRARVLARALRLHQWAKNLLVFVPLLAAHLWADPAAQLRSLQVFVAFCLCASAIYLLNDMLDIEADRCHPRKRTRPIAAGELSIPMAALCAIILAAAGIAAAAMVSAAVTSLLGVYIAATSVYSLSLKSRALLDVIGLAALYTLRIIAGAAAIEVVLSFWLLAFSMFLFLSLSTLKRCAELRNLPPLEAAGGRGYVAADLPFLTAFGAAAAMGAVVILALFVNNPETAGNYRHPQLLWLLCPILIYWIGRMWLLTGRGQMHDDPLVFAARDRATMGAGLLTVTLLVAAV